ncbi:MAG: hypothetical protein QXE81_04270 [Desulfurococcaceae archaeon]
MKITIYIDIARYPHLKLELKLAIELIDKISSTHGLTIDQEEARRAILNFDKYYEIALRRSNGYLIVPKNPINAFHGKVVVHKLRLILENDRKFVELILDRRFPKDILENALRLIGFTEIEYQYLN